MRKLGLILTLAAASAFGGEFTGYVSETGCGAKHVTGSAADVGCVTSCIKRGAKPVLVVDGKVINIANPDKVPASLYGLKAKVDGELKEGTLNIASIEAAK